MITPSFGLTATERVLPKLALDFTTATLDPRITFTRSGNTATYTNSSGVITAINADLPRFDYNPTTLSCRGLLIEEARTNVILNSLIDGTILNTQIVTTSATAYTLSFYGTGSIVLTGTHSATVTGTGAYPSRKTYTFTPTAGALTLTVSGTVQYAQLETGSFATSFIPTSVASVTRNADVATMTGSNFSSWYNSSEGTYYGQGNTFGTTASRLLTFDDGTSNNQISSEYSAGSLYAAGYVNPSAQYVFSSAGATKVCCGFATNNFAAAFGGGAIQTDVSGSVPLVNELQIGRRAFSLGLYWNGWIQKISYWPFKLTNSQIQAISKG